MKEVKVKGLFYDLRKDTITIRRVFKEKLFMVLGDQVVTANESSAKMVITKFKDSVKRYNKLKDQLYNSELKILFDDSVRDNKLTNKQINTINTKDVYEYELYIERYFSYDGGELHTFSSLVHLNYYLNAHFIGFDSNGVVIDENDNVICEKYFEENDS